MSGEQNPAPGKTLILARESDPLGGSWYVEHAGSDLAERVHELFGTTRLQTPYPSSMPADEVTARLCEQPGNAGYTFVVGYTQRSTPAGRLVDGTQPQDLDAFHAGLPPGHVMDVAEALSWARSYGGPDEHARAVMTALADAVEHPDGEPCRAAISDLIRRGKAENDALRAAVEMVRALHMPRDDVRIDGHERCDDCGQAYPCPTMQVLDGGER